MVLYQNRFRGWPDRQLRDLVPDLSHALVGLLAEEPDPLVLYPYLQGSPERFHVNSP